MTIRHLAGLAGIAFACAGCASVVEGTTQPVTITTAPEAGANCTVSNTRGQWSAVTPGTVIVEKSVSVLTIRCRKDGWQEGLLYVAPRMSQTAMIGAFMPYVGIVDAVVNSSSGAAMKYPETITLTLKPIVPPQQAAAAPAVAVH